MMALSALAFGVIIVPLILWARKESEKLNITSAKGDKLKKLAKLIKDNN